MRTGRRWSWGAAGFCCGLIALTKPETSIAATAAVAVAVTGRMLLDRNDRRGTALAMLLFAGCAVVPPACFFVYFLSQMPAADALRGTAGAWVFAVGSGIERSPFYRHGMGLDRPVGNLVRMLASFAGFTIFIAAAAIVTRTATGSRSRSILRRVQQVTLLVAAIGLAQTGLAFVALPLIVMSVLVTSGALFMRARRAPADRGLALRFLMIAIWSAFALVLLAKMGLNPRLVQYGFYLALPAVVSMVIAIAWLIPELIERWSAHGAGPTVRTMAVCAFAGAMVPYLLIAWLRYGQKTLPVGSGRDRLLATQSPQAWQGAAVGEALGDLATAPGASLAVLPEGVMLNYLARRPSPLRVVNLMPPEMMAFGEAEVVRSLEAAPPETVVLVHRDVSEYGVPMFGSDQRYGGRILEWVMARYRPIRIVGDNPLDARGVGLMILQRRP